MTIAQPLSDVVRQRTATVHDASENSGLMSALSGTDATVAAHVALLQQLWFVYEALEDASSALRASGSALGELLDPALDRRAAIEESLAAIDPQGWRGGVRALPATQAYALAIRESLHDEPAYLAHHYTRYLGDLSGGIMIGRNIQRVTGLGDTAVSFYRFPGIAKPRPYKDRYRQLMDALDWGRDARERFLVTVIESYDHNDKLFGDILASAR